MTKTAIGQFGEQFVANYLQQQNWQILEKRWRSRFGEIDLIAKTSDAYLTFIEVKTRSQGNWDQGGALAVNPTKQRKIIQTAQLFLSNYPQLENLPCRFDVALVHYAISQRSAMRCAKPQSQNPIQYRYYQANWQGYDWTLQDYIIAAFEAE